MGTFAAASAHFGERRGTLLFESDSEIVGGGSVLRGFFILLLLDLVLLFQP